MSEAITKPLAHIIMPASKLNDVKSGKQKKAKALCGTYITKDMSYDDGDVCRGCFDQFVDLEREAVNKIAAS